jgi:hypothetical protein
MHRELYGHSWSVMGPLMHMYTHKLPNVNMGDGQFGLDARALNKEVVPLQEEGSKACWRSMKETRCARYGKYFSNRSPCPLHVL